LIYGDTLVSTNVHGHDEAVLLLARRIARTGIHASPLLEDVLAWLRHGVCGRCWLCYGFVSTCC
jgi:hypothetical protein